MAHFQVPQFIEIEDKIFGPLTLKQFVYLAGGGGILFIIYSQFGFLLMVFLGVPILALTLALAFYKINNRPFVNILESGFHYVINSRLYVWKKEKDKEVKKGFPEEEPQIQDLTAPTISQSKLKDLAWKLDIHEEKEGDGNNSSL